MLVLGSSVSDLQLVSERLKWPFVIKFLSCLCCHRLHVKPTVALPRCDITRSPSWHPVGRRRRFKRSGILVMGPLCFRSLPVFFPLPFPSFPFFHPTAKAFFPDTFIGCWDRPMTFHTVKCIGQNLTPGCHGNAFPLLSYCFDTDSAPCSARPPGFRMSAYQNYGRNCPSECDCVTPSCSWTNASYQ